VLFLFLSTYDCPPSASTVSIGIDCCAFQHFLDQQYFYVDSFGQEHAFLDYGSSFVIAIEVVFNLVVLSQKLEVSLECLLVIVRFTAGEEVGNGAADVGKETADGAALAMQLSTRGTAGEGSGGRCKDEGSVSEARDLRADLLQLEDEVRGDDGVRCAAAERARVREREAEEAVGGVGTG